jgi:hypothetical protein
VELARVVGEHQLRQSALTWWSTAQLLAIALVSFGCLRLSRPAPERLLWLAVGCAFVFLAADERFQIHEAVRERLLRPHEIGTGVPGIGPGEIVLPVYALAGLVVAWRLFAVFDRGSGIWLAIGILAAGISVALDSHEMKNAGRNALRLEQFVEELFETAGQACFLAAWSRHLRKLM